MSLSDDCSINVVMLSKFYIGVPVRWLLLLQQGTVADVPKICIKIVLIVPTHT